MAINQLSAFSSLVIRLLHQLVLKCLSLNAWVVAKQVPGVSIDIADVLSVSYWERFWQSVPKANNEGVE